MSTQPTQHLAYIALGSNLGQVPQNLQQAVEHLGATDGCSVAAQGPAQVYPAENARPGAPDYCNGVVAVSTTLNPFTLHAALQQIETQMGRPAAGSRQSNQDRIIDLDLLFYDQLLLVTSALIVPHPRLHRRLFVLEPLCQLVPELVHPAFGLTVHQLLNRLKKESR